MGLFTWGSLPESQISAKTITEAINEAIVAHEEDPTAHLGDGESLQQHKNNEIIDHPAQSIVADKMSVTNAYSILSLGIVSTADLDNLTATGDSFGINLSQASPVSGDGFYNITSFLPYDIGYADGDVVVNFEITAGNGSGTWTSYVYFGFAKIEFKYGYYRVGYYSNGWYYSSWIATQDLFSKRFRIYYDSVNSVLNVYLGANLVYSHAHAIDFQDGEMAFLLMLNRGNNNPATFSVGNLSYALEGI